MVTQSKALGISMSSKLGLRTGILVLQFCAGYLCKERRVLWVAERKLARELAVELVIWSDAID